jgi:hypothetical protein
LSVYPGTLAYRQRVKPIFRNLEIS